MQQKKFEDWPPYKWLWTRVGGQPWTWIMRGNQKQFPMLWILAAVILGLWIGYKCRGHWLYMLAAFVVGLMLDHLFW